MRKAWILAIGFAAVMVFATSAAAHRGAFFGRGFGAPVHPLFVAPRSHAFFSFGAPVHPFFAVPPVLVAPRVIVTPSTLVSPPVIVTAPPAGFTPRAVIVITPRSF
jgi:hypothetical protein